MNNRGITIVEILVGIGIISVIMLTIISLVMWINYYGSKTRAEREVFENARRALEAITHEIRGAKSVYSPTTTSNQLSLETTRYLPADENYTFVDFFICGTALCFKKELESPIAITSESVEVSSIQFYQVVNGSRTSVYVNLTVDYKNPNVGSGNYGSVSMTSAASLRSY